MDTPNYDSFEGIESLDSIEGFDSLESLGSIDHNLASNLAMVDIGTNIFMLLSFIGMGYGIYMLAKKMGIKHAWMGWVPLLQYYTMCRVAGVSFVKHIVVPFLILIGIIIVALISAYTGVIGSNYMLFGTIVGLLYLAGYIYTIVRYVGVLSPISKQTGRGGWTTAGLFFLPFIMFPIVANKYKSEDNIEKEEEESIAKKSDSLVDNVKDETRVEL